MYNEIIMIHNIICSTFININNFLMIAKENSVQVMIVHSLSKGKINPLPSNFHCIFQHVLLLCKKKKRKRKKDVAGVATVSSA